MYVFKNIIVFFEHFLLAVEMSQSKLSKFESIDRKRVGSRLKAIRVRHGLSQEEFAIKIGKSLGGYANYELGRRELPREAQQTIIRIFHDDPFDFSKQKPAKFKLRSEKKLRFQSNVYSKHADRLKVTLQKNAAQSRQFQQQAYSTKVRKLVSRRNGIFAGSALYSWFRLQAIEYGIPFGRPLGDFDWALLITGCTVFALLPFVMGSLIKFFLWRRKES